MTLLPFSKTRNTTEAMRVLTENRKKLIAEARDVAAAIARTNGTVTTRDVRAYMAGCGALDDGGKEFWLGAVFRDHRFRWTGKWATYSSTDRNIHERTIKVWELAA